MIHVRAVFNEAHEVDSLMVAPASELEMQLHLLPSVGDRMVLDDVSYIVSAINHKVSRIPPTYASFDVGEKNGVYSQQSFTILLDKADEHS